MGIRGLQGRIMKEVSATPEIPCTHGSKPCGLPLLPGRGPLTDILSHLLAFHWAIPTDWLPAAWGWGHREGLPGSPPLLPGLEVGCLQPQQPEPSLRLSPHSQPSSGLRRPPALFCFPKPCQGPGLLLEVHLPQLPLAPWCCLSRWYAWAWDGVPGGKAQSSLTELRQLHVVPQKDTAGTCIQEQASKN